jgi:hypothetical protein
MIDAPKKLDAALDAFVDKDAPADAAPAYRTTFVYPPYPLAASTTAAEAVMIPTSTFALIEEVAQTTQNDGSNGAALVTIRDCNNNAFGSDEALTLTVTESGSAVGAQYNLGALTSDAAGVFVVLNIPAGAVDIGGTAGETTLHTVAAVAYENGQMGVTNGSLTTTIVRPGFGSGSGSGSNDVSCASNEVPSTASPPIDVGGTAVTFSATGTGSGSAAALGGVTLTAYGSGSATALGSATSNGSGIYTISNVSTSTVPITVFVEASY